jgi:hypothetical protein
MNYLLTLFSICILFTACDDCAEFCTDPKPDYADVAVKVTIDDENPTVPIVVYYGYVEEGDVFFTDTLSETKTIYEFDTEERYAIKASYVKGDQTIFAIDGGLLTVRRNNDCDDPCFDIKNDVFDLILID